MACIHLIKFALWQRLEVMMQPKKKSAGSRHQLHKEGKKQKTMWLSEDERALWNAVTKHGGYGDVAEMVRDAVAQLHERKIQYKTKREKEGDN